MANCYSCIYLYTHAYVDALFESHVSIQSLCQLPPCLLVFRSRFDDVCAFYCYDCCSQCCVAQTQTHTHTCILSEAVVIVAFAQCHLAFLLYFFARNFSPSHYSTARYFACCHDFCCVNSQKTA